MDKLESVFCILLLLFVLALCLFKKPKAEPVDELNRPRDFYYSAQQETIYQQMASFDRADHKRTLVKGKLYTECVYSGNKPFGNFTDYVFVGTGTFDDVTFDSSYYPNGDFY